LGVPNVGTKGLGLFCLLANIFFPGIGSIVAGLKADKPATMIIGAPILPSVLQPRKLTTLLFPFVPPP